MRALRGPRASALIYALLGCSSCAVGEDVSTEPGFSGGTFNGGNTSKSDASTVGAGGGGIGTGGTSTGGASGSGASLGSAGDGTGGAGGSAVGGASAGGTSAGGSSAGGTSGTLGAGGGSSGSNGAAGTDAGTGCPTGQKKCGGICITPTPNLGCSLANCTPCAAAPANSTAVCTAGQCDFTCASGYRKNAAGTACELVSGTGGTTGTGGSAGTAGTGGSGGTYDGVIGEGCKSTGDCSAIPQGICDSKAMVCVKACMSHDNCGCPAGTTNAMVAAGGCRAACVDVGFPLPNLLCVRVCKAPTECEGNLTTCSSTTAGYNYCG